MFLQKSACARRMYATIVHSKNNSDGSKSEGGFTIIMFRGESWNFVYFKCQDFRVNNLDIY